MNISLGKGYALPQTDNDFLTMEYPDFAELSQTYTEIDITQLIALQQQADTLIIDVRERHEVPILDSQIYQKVPMSEFDVLLNTSIPAENLVFICQHGIRSVAAAEALVEKYGSTKKMFSLKGGIAKWRDYFLKV